MRPRPQRQSRSHPSQLPTRPSDVNAGASKLAPSSMKIVPSAAEEFVRPSQKHGFKLSEFIVYPAHGVGQIIGIEVQEVAGFSLELFVVSFIKDKMILKVPTSKVTTVGMRKLAETEVVDKALGNFERPGAHQAHNVVAQSPGI